MRRLDDINLEKIPARYFQLGCLVLLGLMECFTMVFGILVDGPMKSFVVFYVSVTAMLFVGISIRQPMVRTAKILFYTGLGFCLWLLLLQMSDYVHFSETAYYGARFVYSSFLCDYLMMLPCAALLNEKEKNSGLKIMGWFYILAGAAFCVLTLMVYLQIVPVIFSRFMGWFSTRLGINWHPNLLARIFMVSFGLTVAFLCDCRKLWGKLLLGLLAAAQFVGLALTNSRTAIALGCCVLGGVAFFLVFGSRRETRNWKRFLLGAVAALAVILISYKVSDFVVQRNFRYLQENELSTVQKVIALDGEKEIDLKGRPREFGEGMGSFNGRTAIWSAAGKAICAHPGVLLTGTKDPGAFLSEYYESGFFQTHVAHAHNAWVEVLLRTGLVGLLLSLWITWLAAKNCILVMFFRKTSLFQKVTAMVAICLMGSEFFEPNLFYVEVPASFLNILFMLITGYLVYWGQNAEKFPRKQETE